MVFSLSLPYWEREFLVINAFIHTQADIVLVTLDLEKPRYVICTLSVAWQSQLQHFLGSLCIPINMKALAVVVLFFVTMIDFPILFSRCTCENAYDLIWSLLIASIGAPSVFICFTRNSCIYSMNKDAAAGMIMWATIQPSKLKTRLAWRFELLEYFLLTS